jgi:hypothetical protein
MIILVHKGAGPKPRALVLVLQFWHRLSTFPHISTATDRRRSVNEAPDASEI